MGQYYLFANHDQKEYLMPASKKLRDLIHNDPAVLPYLLKKTDVDGQGPGDLHIPREEYPDTEDRQRIAEWLDSEDYQRAIEQRWSHAGRWAGDRVSVIGDYDSSGRFETIRESGAWTDITDPARKEAKAFEKHPAGQAGGDRNGLHVSPDLAISTRLP